jgi:hypothetical protein
MNKKLPLFLLLFIPITLFGQLTFKKLTGFDAINNSRAVGDQFGFSVAVSGDIAVVGAPFHDFDENGGDSMKDAGAAYVFYRNEGGANNWGLKKKLVATGNNARDTGDNFGNAVAISGNVIVVGAIYQDFNASGLSEFSDAGAAYVFYKDEGGTDNWGLVQKLVGKGNNGRLAEDNFGVSVAISGDVIVVGAYQHDFDEPGVGFVNFSGAAFVYHKDEGGTDNWGQVKKLIGPNSNNGRQAGDFFGTSVAIENDIIAIGANLQDYDSRGNAEVKDAGAVYIFYKDEGGTNNWGLKEKVVGSGTNGRVAEDNFGISVSLSGTALVVGAYLQDFDAAGAGSVNAAGAAYVFYKDKGGVDNWGLVKKLAGSGTNGRTVGDNFGIAVSITGNTVVVGASQQDYNAAGDSLATGAGAVYIFQEDEGGVENWGLKEKIVATGINGRNATDNFGNVVATDPDIILVGVSGQDYDGSGGNFINNAGAAQAFNYQGIDPTSVRELKSIKNVFVSSQSKNIYINFRQEGEYTVSVYDLMGRIVYEGYVTTTNGSIKELNLSHEASGYYMVKIATNKAQKTFKTFLN